MCGRYTLTRHSLREVAEILEAELDPDLEAAYRPRYNVAPTNLCWLVVDEGGHRQIAAGRWGFPIPYGPRADDPVGMINARAETAADKPSFRDAFVRGRCGVIADGFFEWAGPKGRRQPIWFHPPSGELLVFAGLWREHADADTGEVERRFTILTTEANALVEPTHARMPAILPSQSLGPWLQPPPRGARKPELMRLSAGLRGLLRPADNSLLVATPVSNRVSNVRNDDPGCVEGERLLF
ncbi:MAG: SOS response-associated peptidase [Myxococcales bacterium]|nr:SOS response-associated peptidase [Myxococcales bacterium]MCB9702917.1 SOS response-associated peptidase [Myxococcales bacterium]